MRRNPVELNPTLEHTDGLCGKMSSGFFDSMKKASQRFATTVADSGAKAMLKTDIAFLERDIKARKQQFGLDIFEIMSANPSNVTDIQQSFDDAQGDVKHLESKVDAKRKEMAAIDQSTTSGANTSIVNDEAETPGIPNN